MKRIKASNRDVEIIIDDKHHPLIKKYKWWIFKIKKQYYARARISGKDIYLHQMIMGSPPVYNFAVDHINHDTLDNREENLRWVSKQKNSNNLRAGPCHSQYIGVTKSRSKNKPWKASIMKSGIRYPLGFFENEIDAAEAYDKKSVELNGEFAPVNFLPTQPAS